MVYSTYLLRIFTIVGLALLCCELYGQQQGAPSSPQSSPTITFTLHDDRPLSPEDARAVVEGRLGLCAAAAAHRLSRQAASKWLRRYREQGVAGLGDRSSRPHRSPRRIGEAVEQRVIELRRGRLAGYWIARQTGV